ncbi:MAG: hypothetical protein RL488_960 [Actinomycetota bacterium]|jgi:hypothetical protein
MATTRKAPAKTAAKTTTTRTTAARPAATRAVAKAPAAAPAKVKKAKPEPKKAYRLLTGIDDASFCQKVSDALKDGYELYGSPSVTFNGKNVIAAQAVVLKKKKK